MVKGFWPSMSGFYSHDLPHFLVFQVVSTCSPDALELLGELGCHFTIDYKDGEYLSYIQKQAPYASPFSLHQFSSHVQ